MFRKTLSLYSAITLLSPSAQAQKVQPCDLDLCPLSQTRTQQCSINQDNADLLGVTNFTASVSQQPLTWTVTANTTSSKSGSSSIVRRYYLGHSPETNLNTLEAVTGCALFFTGATSSLKFPGTAIPESSGTCEDAMGSACLSALMLQARTAMEKSLNSTDSDMLACDALQETLQNSKPAACMFLSGDSWGSVSAVAITGQNLSAPNQHMTCQPTNRDYALHTIYSTVTESSNDHAQPYTYGVTPIMNVFIHQNQNSSITDLTPEMTLSCVKPVLRKDAVTAISAGVAIYPLVTRSIFGFLAVLGALCL